MHVSRSPLNVPTQGRLRMTTSTELPAQAQREGDTLLGTANHLLPPCPQTLLHLALLWHLPRHDSSTKAKDKGAAAQDPLWDSQRLMSKERLRERGSRLRSKCRKSCSSQDGGNTVLSCSVEELHQHHHQEQLQPRAKRHGGLALLGHEPELIDQALLHQSLLEAILL